jgi:clan AA aspartic protease (TIGR02281 family)
MLLLSIISPFLFSQDRIKMRYENEVYTLPCKVNGLELRFILDTGAGRVSISQTEAMFMLKNGYLSEDDIGGLRQSILADGSIAENAEITLKRIEIGGKVLTNVKALVKLNIFNAPLLLGQSALRPLGTYSVEHNADGSYLIIGKNNETKTANNKTYYYNADWKGVNNKSVATYYRIADNNTKKYKDYYSDGKLQCEGGFISIDPNDATKSIYDGEQKTYYKSGKLSRKSLFKNGKREGERFLYPETGDIYKVMTYKNGERTYNDYEVNKITGQRKKVTIK